MREWPNRTVSKKRLGRSGRKALYGLTCYFLASGGRKKDRLGNSRRQLLPK